MRYLNKLNKKYENVQYGDADLDQYQRDAVVFLKERKNAALFIDTGLGKTAICLRVIRDLVDADEVENVLIIAPLKVAHQTWGEEIEKWEYSAGIPYKLIRDEKLIKGYLGAGAKYKDYVLTEKDTKKVMRQVGIRLKKEIHNNSNLSEKEIADIENNLFIKLRREYIDRLKYLAQCREANRLILEKEKRQPTLVHIINHDNVEWLVDALGVDWFYDTIIFDESDALKNAKTNRWKALDSVKHRLKRFYQLTATPASETYEDLYAQIKLLDGGKRLGRTKTEFMQRYFTFNPYNRFDVKLREGAEKEIGNAISDIALVMKQEDFLPDIPPYKTENVLYPLSPKSLAFYNSMSKKGEIKIGDTVVCAEQAISVLQKMMQICAGFVYDNEETINDFGTFEKDRKIYHLHSEKIEVLKQVMARFPNENFLIAYYHQGSLEQLQKHFPQAVKMDTKGTQKADWNKGKIKMLLMHPKSGAHGLNLQAGGRIVINYDVYFSYGNFYQFLRRLARRGQRADEVLVFNLLAKGTYDEVVQQQCWVEKKSAQEALFNILKRFKHGKSKKQNNKNKTR